jgi:hypothetical protein
MGINSPANRPDPADPGGLGAEESGIERTGPTQWLFFASPHGVGWAEVGRYCDSANDPVTTDFASNLCIFVAALLQTRAVGAIMWVAA